MAEMVTLYGAVNRTVFTVTNPPEHLIANAAGAEIEVIFNSGWAAYLNMTNNRNVKAIFTTQEIDPIAVYNDSTYTYWKRPDPDNDPYRIRIRIPTQVYSAPGFSLNFVFYKLDTDMGIYSERSCTNSVYVRVYPSGPATGSYIGLNPAIDWADLVPTAVSKADWAASTVTTLLSDFQDCVAAYSELVAEASHLTLIDTVTTDTADDNNQKGVKSQGIFDFVEVTKHSQLLATKFSGNNADIASTLSVGNIRSYSINNTSIISTPILNVTSNGAIANLAVRYSTNLSGPTMMIGSTTIQNTTLSVTGTTNVDGVPIIFTRYTELTDTNYSNRPIVQINNPGNDRGIGLKITHNKIVTGITAQLETGAALDIATQGAAALRISGGDVSINKQLYLSGTGFTSSNDIVFSVGSKDEGTNSAMIIKKDGTVNMNKGNVSIQKTLFLPGAEGLEDGHVLIAGNNKAYLNPSGFLYIQSGKYVGTWAQESSVSLKENIQKSPSVLNKILTADICTYHLKADSNPYTKYGLVIGENYNCPEEVLSYDKTGIDTYSMMTWSWKGIQELNDKIVSLENRVAELESQLNNQ